MPYKQKTASVVLFLITLLLNPTIGYADEQQEVDETPPIRFDQLNNFGEVGLISTPTARVLEPGEIALGVTENPIYRHIYVTGQLQPWLTMTLRQSRDVLNESLRKGDNFPGVDFKIRLTEEGENRPAIAYGMRSVLGARRHQAEYLVASKRWYYLDAHLGLGWGRLSGFNKIDNPLSAIDSSLEKSRNYNSQLRPYSLPGDLLTGDNIGIFAGLNYQTPIDKLELHLEYGGVDYEPERLQSSDSQDTARGSPFSIGATYKPSRHLNLSLAWQNLERIVARASVPFNLARLNLKKPEPKKSDIKGGNDPAYLPKGAYNAEKIRTKLDRKGFDIHHIEMPSSNQVDIWYEPDQINAPSTTSGIKNIGQTVADYSDEDVQSIRVMTQKNGLKGYQVVLLKNDFTEKNRYLTTPPEIWRNSTVNYHTTYYKTDKPLPYKQGGWGSDIQRSINLTLDQEFGLEEPEESVVYRTSAILSSQQHLGRSYLYGIGLRFNLVDNLDELDRHNADVPYPVRSDIAEYSDNLLWVDHLYGGRNFTLHKGLYGSITAGYLEELYAGFGVQLLYRPMNSRWAIGGETFYAYKRAPDSFSGFGTNNSAVTTFIADLHYDLSNRTTITASVGRYLAEDYGGSLKLRHRFDNGINLEGYATWTDASNRTVINNVIRSNGFVIDENPVNIGLTLSIPLQKTVGMPIRTTARASVKEMARDSGQRIELPQNLYDQTELISQRHMINRWNDISD